MLYDDITKLSKDIDETIRDYLSREDISDPYSYDRCINHTMKVIMNRGGGHISPKIIESLIIIHRSPFEEKGMMIPC